MTPREWLERFAPLRERVERRPLVAFLIRCSGIFQAIEGRDRVLMLAGQGFIALVPLLVVVASFTSAAGAGRVGDRIIERMGLTDSAAAAVNTLFAYPPGASGTTSLFSISLLLFSLNGFARSVQRTFEGAWGLPKMGIRGTASRTAGLLVLVGAGYLVAWVGERVEPLPVAGAVLAIAVQEGAIVGGWLIATSFMLSHRVPVRLLVAGALLSASMQLVVGWATAIYIPEIFARNAERYGVVGVSLALVTWLIAIAALIVAGAVVSAVLGARGGPNPHPESSS